MPAGGADQVPYVVQLARGRDYDKPAVAVLLDSDDEGGIAAAELADGGPYGRRLLPDGLVVRIGQAEAGRNSARSLDAQTLEDMLPPDLAVSAVRRYLREILRMDDVAVASSTGAVLQDAINSGSRIFAAAQAELSSIRPRAKLAKVGFARAIVAEMDAEPSSPPVELFLDNFRPLMRLLVQAVGAARDAEDELRVTDRFRRRKNAFLRDHRGGATRDEGLAMVRELQRQLADVGNQDADLIEQALNGLARRFILDEDPRAGRCLPHAVEGVRLHVAIGQPGADKRYFRERAGSFPEELALFFRDPRRYASSRANAQNVRNSRLLRYLRRRTHRRSDGDPIRLNPG